jgi:signal transduction histidine kinase
MVVGYLVHRERRERYAAKLEERLRFEKLISAITATFIDLAPAQVDEAVCLALQRVQESMGLDGCVLYTSEPAAASLRITHQTKPQGDRAEFEGVSGARMPWLYEQIRAGRSLQYIGLPGELPEEAVADRAFVKEYGLKAILALPVRTVDGVLHGIGFHTTRQAHEWTPDLVASLQLVGDVLVSSLLSRRHEAALRQTETSMTLAAESALLGFWRWYPDENRSWLTEQARAIYGFTPETRGTHADYLKRIHPEDRSPALERFKQAIKHDESFEHEYRLVFPGNDIRWVVVRARLVRTMGGRLQEIAGVSIDVTGRRQQELSLQQQQTEMARLGRVAMMGEMTAALAHELNQPLTAIVSNASAAKRFISQGVPDPAMMNELLQDITTAGHRAGEIIRDIRGMVKPGGTGRELLDVLKLLRTDILHRESAVETYLSPALPRVEAVPVQIQQVLLNLVVNGLEAMQGQPALKRRIIITTTAVPAEDAHALPGPTGVQLSVRDYGPGLPAREEKRIFEKFYSTKPEGMGLGLAIARSIIEAHRGRLEAANAPGGGAVFTILLNATPPV